MDRYSDKGVVESGTAARMMATYIDLNPVRADMMADPANYRWCGYGEAVGGLRHLPNSLISAAPA